jgi:hypothetical protein
MNPYNFNGQIGTLFRKALIRDANIPKDKLYSSIKSISNNDTIILKDGSEYELTFKKIKQWESIKK